MLVRKLILPPASSPSHSAVMQPLRLRSVVFLLATIAGLALILTGCGGSARLDSRPVVELRGADAPAALAQSCEGPADLKEAPLSAGAVERTWARDRSALASCARSQKAVVDFYKLRDQGLAGGP